MSDSSHLKESIRLIFETNSVKCDLPQVLDALDITVNSVPSLHLYLFELIQNAIDARADRISISLEDDDCQSNDQLDVAISSHPQAMNDDNTTISKQKKLVFLHNGPGGLGKTDRHVRGMSNVFQSTKSVGSVGFMGFGFKTLYKRFTKVKVSDCEGWKFSFDVSEKTVILSETENMSLNSRSWLGAVCPVWDDTIEAPGKDWTTRFEMSKLVSSTVTIPLVEDIQNALFSPAGNTTCLAVLATQGLKSIEILYSNQHYEQYSLSNDSNKVKVQLAQHTKNNINDNSTDYTIEEHISLFKIVQTSFEPTLEATQCLAQARLKNILQHHQQFDKVLAEIRRPYKVVGLIPVDKEGILIPNSGQLFATLPIRSFLPFGISIQADWLLDLSRKGLRDIETNPWQQLIVSQIAILMAKFLMEIPNLPSIDHIKSAFHIFGSSIDAQGNLVAENMSFSLDGFGEQIKQIVQDTNIFPIISSSSNSNPASVQWDCTRNVVLLPRTHYRPKRMFELLGLNAIDDSILSPQAAAFFVKIGLLKALDIEDLVARFWNENGIEQWYQQLDKNEAKRQESLIDLWAFLSEFGGERSIRDLKCVPSILMNPSTSDKMDLDNQSNETQESLQKGENRHYTWTSPCDIIVFEYNSAYKSLPDPKKDLEFGEFALKFVEPSLAENSPVLSSILLNLIIAKSGDWNGAGRIAYEWISKHWQKKSLKQYSRRSFMNTQIEKKSLSALSVNRSLNDIEDEKLKALLHFSGWAAQNGCFDLLTHVLPSLNENTPNISKPIETCLSVIGYPYVDASLSMIHETLFKTWPTIHPIYNLISIPSSTNWCQIFTSLGSKGNIVLEEFVLKEIPVYPSYSESRNSVADFLQVSRDNVSEFQTTSRKGWKIIDTKFKDVGDIPKDSKAINYLSTWLENGVENLVGGEGALIGHGEVWRVYVLHGKPGTANWTKQLNELAWVPEKGSSHLRRPCEVDLQKIALSNRLVQVLERKGVLFGRSLPDKGILDRIASYDGNPDHIDSLAESLWQLKSLQEDNEAISTLVESTLNQTLLCTIDSKKIKYQDLVDANGDELLTLNGFLVDFQQLDIRIKNALSMLISKGILFMPSWPTFSQSSRYYEYLMSEDSVNDSKKLKEIQILMEFLVSEAKEAKKLLRKSPLFKIPMIITSGSMDECAKEQVEWKSMKDLFDLMRSDESQTRSSLQMFLNGLSSRTRSFVLDHILL